MIERKGGVETDKKNIQVKRGSGLYSPPIGKFDEDAVACPLVFSEFVFEEIVIDAGEKHSPRPQDPADEEASVNLLVVVVVVDDRSQRESLGKLVSCLLTDDVEVINQLASPFFPERLLAEIQPGLNPLAGLYSEIEYVGVAPAEERVIRVVKDAVAGLERKAERKPLYKIKLTAEGINVAPEVNSLVPLHVILEIGKNLGELSNPELKVRLQP